MKNLIYVSGQYFYLSRTWCPADLTKIGYKSTRTWGSDRSAPSTAR